MNKRTPFDPFHLPSSTVSGSDGPPQKADALREAYKRHSSELVTIDEQQAKLLLVMLGILSAGATLLASGKGAWQPTRVVQFGLTLITFALLGVWIRFTYERHSYRQAVRDLLVRCELAMGFYATNAYLEGGELYTPKELEFPSKGGFMLGTNLFIVVLAGLGFLLVLWSPEISSWLHPVHNMNTFGL
jgi:hypothetical protein